MIVDKKDIKLISKILKEGKIGVLPTDTIYGIHCLASNKELVDKVHILKQEDINVPLITLISNVDDVRSFNIEIREFKKGIMEKYWPGPNTLIFNTKDGSTRSFRLPNDDFLIEILNETGPLISTSANTHGNPPSKNISDAEAYFGDSVDFYVDGGELNNAPSSIYRIENSSLKTIR